MAGIAEHGLPGSFHFLWFLCAHFIVAALKTLTCHNSTLSEAKSCNIDSVGKLVVAIELREVEGGEVKMCKESRKGDREEGCECVCVCVRECVVYICFTSKCLCYESLPEAEQITVNGIISETQRVKGGIQIKVFTFYPSA